SRIDTKPEERTSHRPRCMLAVLCIQAVGRLNESCYTHRIAPLWGDPLMRYVLEEQLEDGTTTVVGKPIEGLIVAKVVASRRALRTQRLTLVRDTDTNEEMARYGPPESSLTSSVYRMRAANNRLSESLVLQAEK